MQNFLELQCLVDDLVDFRSINVYQCFYSIYYIKLRTCIDALVENIL